MARYGWIAAIILICSELALFSGVELVADYFYLLVWWPYIFILDALIKARKGTSPITSNPSCFVNMCIWSVTIWLIFEIINLRLGNWHYIGLTPNRVMRWLGYALSFATVLPGIFLTAVLIKEHLFTGTRRQGAPGRTVKSIPVIPWCVLGIFFLALPMIWPSYFFPLVWGFSFFLLDPLNRRLGRRSLIHEYLNGQGRTVYALLISGLICGFLWEFWNFRAAAKWFYTVPFVGDWKLFEMPVLGFLGFPPFALECFCMYEFVSGIGLGGGIPLSFSQKDCTCNNSLMFLVFSLLFWLLAFHLIDTYTVVRFKG